MPGKIANSLSHDQLVALLDELRALSGSPTLAQVQAAAKKHGVLVSLEGAKTFRNTTFKAHLERLATGREKSAQILAAVREGGAHPLDAVEEAAASDLLDIYTSGEDVDVAQVVKVALQLRASLEQRKDRDRLDRDLERKLADSEAKRSGDAQRLRLLEEKFELAQLDAAAAVITHAKELKAVTADTKLDAKEKTERVRQILFGDRPTDWQPVRNSEVTSA